MEVPGKREISKFSYKPLNDSQKKVLQRECSSEFEKCEQHQGELIKFYCAQHEQVGCGDCVVIDHRSCKVDYIPDLANEMKVTSKFVSLTKATELCEKGAKQILSSIKNNLVQVDDINEKFKQDVNIFRDEIITLVNDLTSRMLEEGEIMKAGASLGMTNLAEETECLMKDLTLISKFSESNMESPSQLFVFSVSNKPKLDRLMEQLNKIQSRNKIEAYEFKRDNTLCRALATTTQLGKLQKDKEQNSNDQNKTIASDLAKAMERLEVDQQNTDSQPLLHRKLVCRNIKVDGQFLSFKKSDVGEIGLYVDKKKMVNQRYFEIKVLSLGQCGIIVIGLVPDNYKANRQPGWKKNSIAYHGDDGCLYHEIQYVKGIPFGPRWRVGDKIGCGTVWRKPDDVFAFFTWNDRKIGEKKLHTGHHFNLYAAIGMHASGGKVKVTLDAKIPQF